MKPTGQRCHLFRVATKRLIALAVSFVFIQGGSLSLATLAARANETQDESALLPGAKIERRINTDEVHAYSLVLTAGQFVLLVVEAHDGNLVLALQDSAGKTLVEVDNPIDFANKRRLSFVAPQAASYLLTVRTRKNAAPASYHLDVVEWRRSEPKDESAVTAERLFEEAEMLSRRGNGDATREAIQKYDAAVPLWRSAGARLPEAFTLLKFGIALHNLSRFNEAIDQFSQALEIFEETGEERGVAQILTNLGWSHSGFGKYQEALDYFNRSLAIRRRLNEPRAIAQTLNLVGHGSSGYGRSEPGD